MQDDKHVASAGHCIPLVASAAMRETEFAADAPIYQKVGAALESMRMLAMELHQREYVKPGELEPKTK